MPKTHKRGRPAPVTIVGLLLLVQCAALFGLAALFLAPLAPAWELRPEELPRALMGAAFGVLGLAALLACVGLLRLWPAGWLVAMLVQGASLLLALNLYFREKPPYAYLLMLYGICMVLYLNYAEVQATFRPRAINPQREQGR
jgi:hypothetical protein